MNKRAASIPIGRHFKSAHVGTHRIDSIVLSTIVIARTSLDKGRSVSMRIFYIAVERFVIALHLPVGRYGDIIPCAYIVTFLPEVERALRWLGHKVEFPRTIEREITIGLRLCPGSIVVGYIGKHFLFAVVGQVGGYTCFLILSENSFVFPIGRLNFRFFNLFKGKPCFFVFGIISCQLELAILQGVHLATLNFPCRTNDVSAYMTIHRLKLKLGIIPHTILSRPLQQIVNGSIAAAVVEVLRVESIAYNTAIEVEHLDIPILTAVAFISFFAYDVGIVLARIAITEHTVGILHRTNAIG